MNSGKLRQLGLVALLALGVGCSEDETEPTDAAVAVDTGADSGQAVRDTGTDPEDGGDVDTGEPEDFGVEDMGEPEDSGVEDMGEPEDSGVEDMGEPEDSGVEDMGVPDLGPGDSGTRGDSGTTPDAGHSETCSPMGDPCTSDVDCPGMVCGPLAICVPRLNDDCGGFRMVMCGSATPVCMYYRRSDFGPCLTQAEATCMCTHPTANLMFPDCGRP